MDIKIDWPTDKQTDAEGTNNGQTDRQKYKI